MSDLSYTIEVKGVQDLDKLGNVIEKLTGTLNAGAGAGKSLEELRKILVGLKGKGSALEELATAAKGFTDATAEMRKGIGDNFKSLERLLKSEFKQLTTVMQQGGAAAGAAAGVGVAQGMKDSAAVVEKETTALSKSAKANLKALQQDLAGYHNMLRLQVGSQNMRGKQATRMSVDDTRALLGMPDRDSMVQLAAQIKSQMQDALKTEGLRGRSASKMSVDDTRALLGMPDRDSMVQLAAQIKSQMQDALKTEGLRGRSASKMSVDDTRALLGMPDRDSMVQLAAQIKSQMQESMAKEKLRAASASKMTEEDTRSLFGLPSRAEMKTLAAQLKAQMASAIQQTPMKISRMDLGDMKYAEAMGSMRQFYQEEEKAGNATKGFFARLREGSGAMDDAGKKGSALGRVFRAMTVDGNDAHSMARGLASGFNLLWLTWGNLAPLFTGAAISYGVKSVVTMGAEVQNTMETIRVLSQETTASVAALNDQMLELARSGPFGPQAIADAMKTLSLAGLDAASVGSAIKDVMNFAVAGTTDLKTAADVMTSVATAFGIAATGYNYVGDIISKTAAVSKSSVESIGEAFKTASVINKQYGISLEDVGVGLAALSNLGIQGSAAGTALRNMYADLSERTPKVAKAMESVGLKLRDQNGEFKDIISMVMEFDRVMSDLSTGLEKKALLRDVLSERGAKPIIELRDLAIRVAKEVGTTTQTELERLKARIVDSAGFMANAAAEMAMTPLNQMKSVTAALQATLVEAFNGLAPVILQVSARLKEAFASEEFKSGLATLMQLVSSFTVAIVENIGVLTKLAAAFALFKGAQIVLGMLNGLAMAAAGMTAALTGATVATVAASTVFTRLIGLFNPITAVLTVAYTAWQLYSIYTDKANKSTEQAATSGYHDQLIAKLEEETKRLNENTEAMRLNISVDELRAQREGRKLADAAQDSRRGAISGAQGKITKAQSDYDKLASRSEFIQTPQGERELLKLAKRVEDARDEMWKLVQNNMAQDARMDSAKQSLKNAAQENADEVRRQAAIKAAIEAARVGPNTYKPIDPYGGDKTALKAVSAVRQNLMKETEEANRNELAAIKAHQDSKHRLLKADADATIISQGEFMMREIALTEEGEAKQLEALKLGSEKYFQAYEAQSQALLDKQVKWKALNGKATKDQIEKEADDTQAALDNLTRDYITTITGMAQQGVQIKFTAVERLQLSAKKAVGEINALQKSFKDFWAAEENSAAAKSRAAALEEQLRFASPEQIAYLQAYSQEYERLQSKIESVDTEYSRLNKELEAVIVNQMIKGTLTDEESIALTTLAEKVAIYRQQLEKLREAQGTGSGKAGNDALTKYAKEESKRLTDGLSDSIMTALFEGGKAGSKKLRDLVVNELKKPIKLVVDVVANMIVGSLGLGATGSAAAGSAAGSAGSSMLGSFASGLSGNLLTGGVGMSGMAGFTSGLSAWGAGGSVAGVLSNPGLYSLAEIAGALGPISLGVGAILLLAKKGKTPGEQHTGGFYSSTGATGMEAARAITPSDGAARDLIKRANPEIEKLVKTTVDSVIKASTAQAKILGMNIAVGIDAGFAANTNGKAKNKNAFGYFDVKINGETVAEYVNRELGTDLTEAVTTWTTDMRDAVAEWVLGGEEAAAALAKDGESASQTLTRLSTSLVLVNDAMNIMNKNLLTASVASGNLASQVIDEFGGQENFASAHQAYFQSFYTEAERAAAITRNLNTQFADMNLALPTTNAEYRALVEAQDLSTESGREAYAFLVKLAPTFDEVGQAAKKAAATMRNAWQQILEARGGASDSFAAQSQIDEGWKDYLAQGNKFGIGAPSWFKTITYDDLQNYTSEEQVAIANIVDGYAKLAKAAQAAADEVGNAAQAAKDAAEEAAQAARDAAQTAFDALQKTIDAQKELAQKQLDLVTRIRDIARAASNEFFGFKGNAGMSFAQASAFVSSSANAARTGGALPDADKLEEAVAVLKQQFTTDKFTTLQEFNLAKSIAAADLDAIADVAETEMSVMQAQLDSLNAILESSQAQLNALLGINTSILTVTQAVASFQAAVAAAAAPTGGSVGGSTGGGGSIGGSGNFVTGGGGSGFVVGGSSGGTIYESEADRLAGDIAAWEAAGKDWTVSYLPGVGPVIVGGGNGTINDTQEQWLKNAGVPGFASGGIHTGGWAMVGEQGPELLQMPAGRVYNNGQTQDILAGDSKAATEVSALRQEIAELRTEVRATASHTNKTQRLLERITRNGESMQVTVVA